MRLAQILDGKAAGPSFDARIAARVLEHSIPVGVGTRLRRPALATTLARLQRFGPEEFYRGEIARRIVAAVHEAAGS
jgi:gamma-glutamyltranspeptidase/glutathione hydrolase